MEALGETWKKRMTAIEFNVPKEGVRRSTIKEAIDDKQMPEKHARVFMDAKAMKEQLRQNMHKPRYDVTNYYWDTGYAQQIARDSRFENITLAVIALNALWIAIDTDANNADDLTQAHAVFIVAENLFCIFFTFEIIVRFLAFRDKLNCFKDSWFVFDLFMVALMVFETWIMFFIMLAIGGSSSSGVGNASMLRLLRLLRLSRMARMARLLRSMPELLMLIKGMIAAIRSVFFTLVLLFLLLYVFAILFRQMSADTDLEEDYFPGMGSAIHTLVLDGILFDSPGDLMSVMIEDSQYHLILAFYLFVLLATLTVMNMLIGVLCEVVSAVADAEREEMTILYVRERLQEIVDRCCPPEADHELAITKEQFLVILQDVQAARLLTEVKVDVVGLVDLIDTIFATETGIDRELSFGDLVEVCMDQRTTNTATVKDVTDLRKYVRGRLDRMEQLTEARIVALGTIVEKSCSLGDGYFINEVNAARQARLAIKDQQSGQPKAEADGTGSAKPNGQAYGNSFGDSRRVLREKIIETHTQERIVETIIATGGSQPPTVNVDDHGQPFARSPPSRFNEYSDDDSKPGGSAAQGPADVAGDASESVDPKSARKKRTIKKSTKKTKTTNESSALIELVDDEDPSVDGASDTAEQSGAGAGPNG